ncbi:hypothetical protein J4476_01340 [Candidatus Woesearchaeota archaeon]|nr:MAG: hypothetical protein QT09_C0006G0060 [archaeon GW2011_AR18]MBS3161322.1 hypothetical protein [Candidatus Woesearchaeota archaeon]HIH26277.1 hypothetical protein [Nanoarchaeota archaeon]
MTNKIKELFLNTPEKYWFIIFGYHIHKSFWGVLFIILGIIVFNLFSKFFGIVLLILGLLITTLSICGHIYTNNKPYFKLWDKYNK